MRTNISPMGPKSGTTISGACAILFWTFACADESAHVSTNQQTVSPNSPTESSTLIDEVPVAPPDNPIEFATYLPSQQTLGLISIRHFDSLLQWMSEDLSTIHDVDGAQPFLEWMHSTFDIESLEPNAFVSTGLSLHEPWTLAILGFSQVQFDEPDLELAFIFPVVDAEQSTEYLNKLWSSNQLAAEQEQHANHNRWTIDSVGLSVAIVNQRLIGCMGLTDSQPSGENAKNCLEKLLSLTDSEQLFHDEHFAQTMQVTNPEWSALAFANSGWFDPEQMRWTEDEEESFLPLLQGVQERIPAGAVALVAEPHQVRIETRILVNSETSHEFGLAGEDKLAQRIPGHSLAFARFSLKLLAAWQVFQNWEPTEPELNVYSNMAFFAGLDLESDLLDNFIGHFSIVMLVDTLESNSAADWVAYAPVKDVDLTRQTLNKLYLLAQKENFGPVQTSLIGSDSVYVMNDEPNAGDCTAVGVQQGHLIVVQSSSNRCVETMNRIDEENGSFMEHLDDHVKKQYTAGPPTYAYVDVEGLLNWMAAPNNTNEFSTLRSLIAGIELSAWSVPGYHGHDWILIPPNHDIQTAVKVWLENRTEEPIKETPQAPVVK